MKRGRWLAAWLVGVVLGSLLGVAPVRAAGPDVFESTTGLLAFSPNGDGRRDVARVAFRTAVAAHVTAKIRVGDDLVVRTVDLGRLGKGDHVFRWDGRTRLGRVLPDGRYAVVLVAQTANGRDSAQTSVDVDTTSCARLMTTRPTVYPRATVVDDMVQLMLVDCAWSAWDAEMGEVFAARTRLQVLDRRGEVMWAHVVRDQTTPTFTWDGRRRHDGPARPGVYQAWATSIDPAGNRARFLTALRVSWDELAERTTSFTMTASLAGHYVPEFGGCNGCADICGPKPSTRFPGGLSFQPCESSYQHGSYGFYAASSPTLTPAPVDSYRVTTTGGPTAAGEDDTGQMVVGEQLVSTTPVGDGSTTSAWVPVALAAHPYLPVGGQPVFWSFGTHSGNAYDVASFTVHYRHYVPVS